MTLHEFMVHRDFILQCDDADYARFKDEEKRVSK